MENIIDNRKGIYIDAETGEENYEVRYENNEKDLIKANPGNLALQWVFVNKKMIY